MYRPKTLIIILILAVLGLISAGLAMITKTHVNISFYDSCFIAAGLALMFSLGVYHRELNPISQKEVTINEKSD